MDTKLLSKHGEVTTKLARRVMALIHWQALKLFLKGAGFRPRPEPPQEEVSR